MWGMNLFAADGDVWRKHRRVVGPAFNNKLYVTRLLTLLGDLLNFLKGTSQCGIKHRGLIMRCWLLTSGLRTDK